MSQFASKGFDREEMFEPAPPTLSSLRVRRIWAVFRSEPSTPAGSAALSWGVAAAAYLGFGRIVASEIDAPNILVNIV